MKITQLNVWQGRMPRALMRFFEHERPDIICLQEVFDSDVDIPYPDRMFDILARIKQAAGLEYVYFSPTFSIEVTGETAFHGNAILSRYPLITTETIQIEQNFIKHMTVKNKTNNIRNLQITQLDINGRIWTIANHHAHHSIDPLGDDMSVDKMQKVAEILRRKGTPLVLCGDLNITAESPAMRVFDGWLDDLIRAQSNVTTTLARVNVDRDVVCDHVLVSDDVIVDDFKVSNALISDHYPLILQCH